MSSTSSEPGKISWYGDQDRGVIGPNLATATEATATAPVATRADIVTARVVDERRPVSPFVSADTAIRDQKPVTWREVAAVLAIVAVCDVTIYRGHGFAGLAALFATLPIMLAFGASGRAWGAGTKLVGIFLWLLAAKAVWCGSALLVAVGFFLVGAFALGLTGQSPQVVEAIAFALQTFAAGFLGLLQHARAWVVTVSSRRQPRWVNVALPVGVCLLFAMIFVLANPNLMTLFSEGAERFFTSLRQWLTHVSLFEIWFWMAVIWVTVGLLRPLMVGPIFAESPHEPAKSPPAPAPLYSAFRNTLLTVVVLFTVYLGFEFQTLWFRVFEPGFHYSGYAHEGAAWLTCALALATLLLSLIFRGGVLNDARLPGLRRLAWIWSAQNFVLAAAVFHRMFIYIGFNGMTQMRTVGLFGISCVVVGFSLVLWKIARDRDFVWLLRRQLWTLAAAICLYALTPVDTLVVHYNVRRIQAGELAPAVQISVHPINAEGVLLLQPLTDCPHETIREGVRAMLADRLDEAEELAGKKLIRGWTAFQYSDDLVLRQLRANQSHWSDYQTNRELRADALRRFRDYAYQWY